MSISLEAVSAKYLTAKKLSGGTRKEYKSTITKWTAWGNGVDVDQIDRSHIREFLDWVHEKAAQDGGSNPGRTANKARENLRAIMSWAWEQEFVAKLPGFPKPKATTRCRWAPLSDKTRSQRSVLRHLSAETTAWMDAVFHGGALLASCSGRVLQLRR